MSDIKPTMLLSSIKLGEANSFQLIPLTKDCPFVEALYVPQDKALVILNKEKKVKYHFVPKLDDAGLEVPIRNTREAKVKQQRDKIEMYHEHYLFDKSEIEEFIKRICVNEKTFDYNIYLNAE
jgi:hypothetical protein